MPEPGTLPPSAATRTGWPQEPGAAGAPPRAVPGESVPAPPAADGETLAVEPEDPPPWADLGLAGGLDTAGLFLVLLLAGFGFARGLWWQVVRLLGLVAAVLVARTLGPRLGTLAVDALPEVDPRVLHGFAWLAIFLAALAAAALFGRLGRSVLEALHLGLLDRVGGALAGAATGVVLQAVVALGLARLAPETWVADHVAGSRSERLVGALAGDVPLLLDGASWEPLAELLEAPPGASATPPGSVEAGPPAAPVAAPRVR